MNWNDISIKQYDLIQEIDMKQEPLDLMVELASIVHKVDIDVLYDTPIDELNKYIDGIDFVFKTPEPVLKDTFKVGDTEFKLDATIQNWGTGRYIDYMRVLEQMPNRFDLIMATLYLPDGKKYGEFDIMQSAKMIYENLPITYVLGASSFFLTLLKGLTKAILSSLKKDLKKGKDKETIKMIQKAEEIMELYGI